MTGYFEAHPWEVLGWVCGFWAAALLGALWAEPTLAPQGAVLVPSMTGRAAAFLVAHVGKIGAVAVALAGGFAGWRWPWVLVPVVRVGVAVGAVAVVWAVVRP